MLYGIEMEVNVVFAEAKKTLNLTISFLYLREEQPHLEIYSYYVENVII